MTGRLIFSTIGVPRVEDDMWSPAFREGKWGVTEAGRKQREASWETKACSFPAVRQQCMLSVRFHMCRRDPNFSGNKGPISPAKSPHCEFQEAPNRNGSCSL